MSDKTVYRNQGDPYRAAHDDLPSDEKRSICLAEFEDLAWPEDREHICPSTNINREYREEVGTVSEVYRKFVKGWCDADELFYERREETIAIAIQRHGEATVLRAVRNIHWAINDPEKNIHPLLIERFMTGENIERFLDMYDGDVSEEMVKKAIVGEVSWGEAGFTGPRAPTIDCIGDDPETGMFDNRRPCGACPSAGGVGIGRLPLYDLPNTSDG